MPVAEAAGGPEEGEGIDHVGAEGTVLFYLVANAGKMRGFVIRAPLGAARGETQAGRRVRRWWLCVR